MSSEPRPTPAEKLRLAFDLYEFAEAMLRQRLRRENPCVTETEIDLKVGDWLSDRPGAENGDGDGVPGTWPRTA